MYVWKCTVLYVYKSLVFLQIAQLQGAGVYAVLIWFSQNDQRNTSGMVFHPAGPVAVMDEGSRSLLKQSFESMAAPYVKKGEISVTQDGKGTYWIGSMGNDAYS